MKRWQGPRMGAFLALLISGSLIFFVPFVGALIAGMSPFDRLTAYSLAVSVPTPPVS